MTASKASRLNPIAPTATMSKLKLYNLGARKAPIARPRDRPATLNAIRVARAFGKSSVMIGKLLTRVNSKER